MHHFWAVVAIWFWAVPSHAFVSKLGSGWKIVFNQKALMVLESKSGESIFITRSDLVGGRSEAVAYLKERKLEKTFATRLGLSTVKKRTSYKEFSNRVEATYEIALKEDKKSSALERVIVGDDEIVAILAIGPKSKLAKWLSVIPPFPRLGERKPASDTEAGICPDCWSSS